MEVAGPNKRSAQRPDERVACPGRIHGPDAVRFYPERSRLILVMDQRPVAATCQNDGLPGDATRQSAQIDLRIEPLASQKSHGFGFVDDQDIDPAEKIGRQGKSWRGIENRRHPRSTGNRDGPGDRRDRGLKLE